MIEALKDKIVLRRSRQQKWLADLMKLTCHLYVHFIIRRGAVKQIVHSYTYVKVSLTQPVPDIMDSSLHKMQKQYWSGTNSDYNRLGKTIEEKTASRDKKETTREQETEESDEVLQRGRKGQNGNKSSHAGSIIQSEDVDICRNNIRERCKYGENCNRHHCNLPYHWQYKVPTQPWKSFPLVVNETLEMNFCDKDIDNAIVSVGNDRCVVDFNQMKGKVKDGELTLRRLSTSSACEAPPGETLVTNWTWYWKHENDGFLKYTNVSILR
ncbi:hypothetical protein KUTeg_017235 [Tegillarca granosa]|uniref:C3H1-type domain-containing protein n=1 Tax=Tegillarca granosa TaxID=220873 RepID=A0ABQ9EIV3_TEGGR|nr:hypothetical protein KUTeg_017235 [Tegillarca granosa]